MTGPLPLGGFKSCLESRYLQIPPHTCVREFMPGVYLSKKLVTVLAPGKRERTWEVGGWLDRDLFTVHYFVSFDFCTMYVWYLLKKLAKNTFQKG